MFETGEALPTGFFMPILLPKTCLKVQSIKLLNNAL